MEKIAKASKKVFLSYRTLPHKKQYLEFFTALLSIPVLLTVILLNLNSLKALKNPTPPSNQMEKIYVTIPGSGEKVEKQANGTQAPCKQEIGPIDIISPKEGEIVYDNPVSINVSYKSGTYCAAVWSYRINGGRWSEYDDKSIALYNLPQGNIKLELRVKSVVASEEKTLTRNFTYNGGNFVPTSSISPSAAQSDQAATPASN